VNWFGPRERPNAPPRAPAFLFAKLLPELNQPWFGEAIYETDQRQNWMLRVEVEFRPGREPSPVSVQMAGRRILTISPVLHEASGALTSRRGDRLRLTPGEGMSLEVFDRHGERLSGIFERRGWPD
jgi:hypothetical protein